MYKNDFEVLEEALKCWVEAAGENNKRQREMKSIELKAKLIRLKVKYMQQGERVNLDIGPH